MDKAFEIDLLSLKEGSEIDRDYHIGEDFFKDRGNGDVVGSDVDVHLHVTRRHDTYMLEFDMEGTLEAPCDRCLDPVSVDIDTTYDLAVRHGDEYDDSHDDLLVIPDNWTRLDVSNLIYDTLLLEIPLRCVHPDGGCNAEMEHKLGEMEK